MKAYKGFHKDLTCIGYQFNKYGVNRTKQANCRKNGFHCAENPLDCLFHYRDWKNSVYYMVEAGGDIDEDEFDSKISCTELKLIKKLSLLELLSEGIAYMVRYPNRPLSQIVFKESGEAPEEGYAVIRGANPKGKGKSGAILVLLKEEEQKITEVAVLIIDGKSHFPNVWYNIYGEEESECAA